MSGIVGSKFNHRGSGLVASYGTDGQHMLSAGPGISNVFETVSGGGAYVKISTTTVSSGVASVDFDTLSTDYKDFKIVVSGMVNATHSQWLTMRVKRSGETTFDSGSDDYLWNAGGTRDSGTLAIQGSNIDEVYAILTSQNLAAHGTVAGASHNYIIDVYDVHATSQKKFIGNISFYTEGDYGRSCSQVGSAYRNNVEALIGVQLIMTSGNINKGYFTLYGRAV